MLVVAWSKVRTLTLDNELLEVLKEWKEQPEKYNVKEFVLSYDDNH